MSNEFFLAWTDFHKNMATGFQQVLQNEEFVDVTLVSSDNVKIKAHKIVISTGSGFFRSVLSENTLHHPIIYLRGVTQEVLQALVDFLYLGQVKIQKHLLKSFMETALDLDVHGLKNLDTINWPFASQVKKQDDQAKHDKIVEGSFWDEFSMIPDPFQENIKNQPIDIDVTDINSFEDKIIGKRNDATIHMNNKVKSIEKGKRQKLQQKQRGIKVKKFKPSWLDMYFDGVKAVSWLKADPTDESRGVCMVCPPNQGLNNCSFTINEGRAAIQQHSSMKKHKQALKDVKLL